MSTRSIVEFNHDMASLKIDAEPEQFMDWLRYAISTADWDPLERFGIRLAQTAHHSDERKVVVNGHEVKL